MKNKTVLITGAAGFIGSHLTRSLIKGCGKVKAFIHYNSRNDIGLLSGLSQEELNSLEIIASDVIDPVAVYKAMKNVDIVFHLAALIGIPYSYYSPNSYVQTNINGTMNILNAALELGTSKIIHTSTSEVYGTAQYVPIDENHPLKGQSPYSATKISADKLAESYYLSFNLPVVTVRPFNTFGPRQSLRAVIPTIITQAIEGNLIKIGNTNTVRDFNYVKDTVSGFILAAKSDSATGEVINIGSGTGVTINYVISYVSKYFEKDLKIIEEKQRIRPDKSEVFQLVCDNSKAEKLINWKPKYTFDKALDETLSWFVNNSNKIKNTGNYTI